MKIKKYGLIAKVEVQVGAELPDGMVEVYLPKTIHMMQKLLGECKWHPISVPKQSIKNNTAFFIIVDRDFDDGNTSLLCPDMQTIIAVHDVIIKVPFWRNVWRIVSGKRIKMSEI